MSAKYHILAPFVAVMSLLISMLIRGAYEFDTWQCLISLSLVDFLFVVLVSSIRIDCIKVHWMNLVFHCSIIANVTFSVIVYMRFNGIISEVSAGFNVIESIYHYVGAALTLMLFIFAFTRQRILGKFDDLCWPRIFDDVRIFDSYDSWQDHREVKK